MIGKMANSASSSDLNNLVKSEENSQQNNVNQDNALDELQEVEDVDEVDAEDLGEEDNRLDENENENPNENSEDADAEEQIDNIESIEIAPTNRPTDLEDEYNPLLFVQLGDRILVESKKYGRTIGTVYYRSLEYIRIKPDGVSNALHTFEVEQTEDEEVYKEEDGVTVVSIIEKRAFESFVEQQDFRINQIIDTFAADGSSYKTYKIIEVDKENDSIKIQDIDDPETDITLEFNFIGIEPDEDFLVISIRKLVGDDDKNASNDAPMNEMAKNENSEEGEEGEDGEEEEQQKPLNIKIVGFIEIAKPKVYREAESYEQQIPDNLQKIDALNDFISGLDPSLQKDPKALRSVRILVETLFNLKQLSIIYNSDGSIAGPSISSVKTLKELIETTHVPLGRPVLTVSKKLYDPDESDKVSDSVHFENFYDELDQMNENKSKLVSSSISGGSVVREWDNQRTFLKQYYSPWTTNDKIEPIWKAFTDSDFFREAPPEIDEGIFQQVVPGYIASHDKNIGPFFDNIPFATERALSTTYRKGANRTKEVLLEEDSATLQSYMLFPIDTANYIGMKRSSLLAVDSGRSLLSPKNMKMILKKAGGPKEPGTSNDIILLSVTENTLGNIPLADYINGMSIPALGLGDTFMTLEQYGMNTIELNMDIKNALSKKIAFYQAQLLSSLSTLREMIELNPQTESVQNPFIENPNFLEMIRSQPMLADALVEHARINPTFSKSDIGIVNYLMQMYPTYFQIAVGTNPLLIAKATLYSKRMEYIRQRRITTITKYNEMHRHIAPPKNKCTHVSDLVSVRKIQDDNERFQELTNFFRRYQGGRDQNWINCNICKQHLLCMHERLQIQAYLNQTEKESIDKEIILMFSGGQFQGKYICRNCGQSIKELDFDNNLEFDDNGKPKSGRSVIVDEDAIFEEKLDLLISPPIEESKQGIQFNEEEMRCYKIVHELSTLLGVYLDMITYKSIIARIIKYINNFDKIDVYNKKRELNPKMQEYNVTIARFLIIASAIYLLIDIQTKIPSYVARYSFLQCESPGFNGYPLDPEITNLQGITYMACAIVSFVNKNEYPWNQTGFNKIAEDKLQKGIIVLLRGFVNENVINDNIIQSELSEKRHYLINVLGRTLESSGDIIKDMIPASFLPEQLRMTPELAAQNAITPEVVALMQQKGQLALSKLWIRHAHVLAKNNAVLIRGTPFMETTCCASSIEDPQAFWEESEKTEGLPKINGRKLMPTKQGQFLLPNFIPREAGTNVTEPNSDLFYRLFLKYCFQGPRIGHLHETGLTHKCSWCGFQFPTNPSIMDTDTEGKASLVSQEVKTDTEEFTKLLDTIHTVNRVEPVQTISVSPIQKIMVDLSAISIPPIHGWADIIMLTTQNFLRLSPDADESDIAIAAGPISEISKDLVLMVNKSLPDVHRKIIKSISELSWMNFFQVLQNYFIVPIQRILQNFTKDQLFPPIELMESLSDMHIIKAIIPILEGDTELLDKRSGIVKYAFAMHKLTYYMKQISALLPYKNKIRSEIIPGKEKALKYIQQILLYGPLASLLNQNEVPPTMNLPAPMKMEDNTKAVKQVAGFITLLLEKYNREKLSFNDDEIRKMIAIRDEKERVNVVAEFDKLTEEERGMELMNKRLGLGKWAVGGTKLIYAYDKDYYDLERQKRLDAGLIDFPGHGNGEMGVPEGRQTDADGFPVFSDTDYEREGGYDHNQHTSDD